LIEQTIFDPLLDGKSPWCKNCFHHINNHNLHLTEIFWSGKVPLCSYKTAGVTESCKCKKFESMEMDRDSDVFWIGANFLLDNTEQRGRAIKMNVMGKIRNDRNKIKVVLKNE